MRIDIQTHGFDLTEGLRQHTERRLQFALSWANHDIRSVSVDLSDVNGARGGPGKRCRIQIPLPRVQPVVIEEVETDLYVAIDRAADRSERTVARRLERLREHRPPQAGDAPATGSGGAASAPVDESLGSLVTAIDTSDPRAPRSIRGR